MRRPSADFERFVQDLRGRSERLPENLLLMDTVDSTNRFVRSIAERFFEEETTPGQVLVVAWEQTAGRGRQGRTWVSSAGRGLYCTWLQPLGEPGASLEDELGTLPLLAGIAVCRAVDSFVDGEAKLKWPNDVLVGGRKISGILIETVTAPEGETVAVIGFGVNHDFGVDTELPTEQATSLALESAATPSRADVVEALAGSLGRELAHGGDLGYTLSAYRTCTGHREGDVVRCRIGGETVSGEFAGFDEGGRFLLRTATGPRTIASGEVIES